MDVLVLGFIFMNVIFFIASVSRSVRARLGINYASDGHSFSKIILLEINTSELITPNIEKVISCQPTITTRIKEIKGQIINVHA